jgi:hypothetical protein
MTRRGITAVAALAVAALTSLAPAPVAAEAADDSCGAGLPFAGTAAGTVGRGDDADWRTHAAVPGSYLVTLTSGPSDADLVVGDGACGTLCDSAEDLGTLDRCTATTAGFGLTIGVTSLAKTFDAAYVVTVTPIQAAAAATACNDDVDNDMDGAIDAPSDPGCSGPNDTSEDDPECSRAGASEVCAKVVVGDEREVLTTSGLTLKEYEVAGYLDVYRFGRPGGAHVDVPCVVLVAKPHGTANACRFAGGTFVTRTATLLHPVRSDVPRPPLAQVTYVRVCDAELTVTVDGHGPKSLPVVAPC